MLSGGILRDIRMGYPLRLQGGGAIVAQYLEPQESGVSMLIRRGAPTAALVVLFGLLMLPAVATLARAPQALPRSSHRRSVSRAATSASC